MDIYRVEEFQPSLRDGIHLHAYPAMNRWATIRRPSEAHQGGGCTVSESRAGKANRTGAPDSTIHYFNEDP
jgi:hypothetical protein